MPRATDLAALFDLAVEAGMPLERVAETLGVEIPRQYLQPGWMPEEERSALLRRLPGKVRPAMSPGSDVSAVVALSSELGIPPEEVAERLGVALPPTMSRGVPTRAGSRKALPAPQEAPLARAPRDWTWGRTPEEAPLARRSPRVKAKVEPTQGRGGRVARSLGLGSGTKAAASKLGPTLGPALGSSLGSIGGKLLGAAGIGAGLALMGLPYVALTKAEKEQFKLERERMQNQRKAEATLLALENEENIRQGGERNIERLRGEAESRRLEREGRARLGTALLMQLLQGGAAGRASDLQSLAASNEEMIQSAYGGAERDVDMLAAQGATTAPSNFLDFIRV